MEKLITAKDASLMTQHRSDRDLDKVISTLNGLITRATELGKTSAVFRTKNKAQLDLAIRYLRFADYSIETASTTVDPWSMDGNTYTQEFSWPRPIQKSFS